MTEARILRNDSIHEIDEGNSSCRDSPISIMLPALHAYDSLENQITSFIIDLWIESLAQHRSIDISLNPRSNGRSRKSDALLKGDDPSMIRYPASDGIG